MTRGALVAPPSPRQKEATVRCLPGAGPGLRDVSLLSPALEVTLTARLALGTVME